MTYQHREAYCLMMYKCDKCHATERFWNSRDGVTPFIVLERCIRCLGNMQHIDFYMDTAAPDHVPHQGQGVFTDMPDALKRTYAHIRLNAYRKMGGFDGSTELAEVLSSAEGGDVDELTEEAFVNGFQPGEPFFFRWRA